jgi:hypothetical protein
MPLASVFEDAGMPPSKCLQAGYAIPKAVSSIAMK